MALEKKLTEEQRKQVLDEILPSMIEQKLSRWRGDDITVTDRNMRGSILLWLKDKFNLWEEQEFEELLERECPGSSVRRSAMEQVGFQGYGYYDLNIVEEMIKFSFLKRYLSSLMENGLVSEEPSSLASKIKSLFQYENDPASYLSMMKALDLDEQLSIEDMFECSTLRCPKTVFIKKVGQGKGGATYKIFSENLQQYRAMKIINHKRVNPEAMLMARLSGKDLENIVQIYDAGNHLVTAGREKAYAILMEYVDGQTLEEILQERRLTPEAVVDYSAQILNGIQSLRKHGITHRDLNLRNIKVNSQGEVKILDFGIATDEQHPKAKDNRKYGAPKGEEADDIFSFGLLVYQMATGEHIITLPEKKEDIDSSARADKIALIKKEMYQEGKLCYKYEKKIYDKINGIKLDVPSDCRLFNLSHSHSELCYLGIHRISVLNIVLSCLKKEGIETIKSHYSGSVGYSFLSKRELIQELKKLNRLYNETLIKDFKSSSSRL